MNKIEMFWNRLKHAADVEAKRLHDMTGFEYRTTKQINGYHVEGYSTVTKKWYTVKVVSTVELV